MMQGRDDIRLTALTVSRGNAAKINEANLVRLFHQSAPQIAPSPVDGSWTGDRAAISTLTTALAVIQVADLYPPIVDDPFIYGAIAAANAMSNVYALGGEVTMGVNVVAWPSNLPAELLTQVIAGAAAKMAEAGALVAEGQVVTADSPLYGLSVTGTVDPTRILTKGGTRAGDRLYLTKAIGTGVILTAMQREAAKEDHVIETTAAMLRLNRVAAQLAQEVGVSACADIGGFGLLGHAAEVAAQSGVRLQIALEAVPFLSGALEYAELGFVPTEIEQSRNYFAAHDEHRIVLPGDLRQSLNDLLHDPQTSGGLLLVVPAEHAATLEAAFAREKAPLWPIGEVVEGSGVAVVE